MPGERPSPREFRLEDDAFLASKNAERPDASLRDLAEHGSNLNQRFAALREQQESRELTAREEAELQSLQQQLNEVDKKINGGNPSRAEETRKDIGRASENRY